MRAAKPVERAVTLGLVIGASVQAWEADPDALVAPGGTNAISYRSGADAWSAETIGGDLTFNCGRSDALAGVERRGKMGDVV